MEKKVKDLELLYDYSAICSCGAEIYASILNQIKNHSLHHLRYCEDKEGEVYINRHERGGDIDDSFKEIKVTKVDAWRPINNAHRDILKRALGY